jgi:hypothetical protein
MRSVVTILTTIGVGALLALDNPKGFSELRKSSQEWASRIWNQKEVRVDGLEMLSRAEVEKLLPLERSVPWWHLNGSEIQAKLSQNSWIDQAKLSSCPDSWSAKWGCFLVSVQERKPTFVATFDNTSWVIDRDGSFLVPLSELRARKFQGTLVAVRGVSGNGNSPDLVRAQLSVAARLRETLEKSVSKQILGLEFLGQGDFAVAFQGVPFPVVFAAGQDAKVPLLEQGARCTALLNQLANRFSEIERIDLAFDRVGVVRFK